MWAGGAISMHYQPHLALSMAIMLLAVGSEVALKLSTGAGWRGGVTLGPAPLWAQDQTLGASIAFFAPNAWLAHTLPCHLLTVVSH